MSASSQSVSVPSTIQAAPIRVRPPLAVQVAQRAMPLVTASVGVALATLAAERALAGIALRAVERTGLHRLTPAEPTVTRVTVTRTTVVERITRRG